MLCQSVKLSDTEETAKEGLVTFVFDTSCRLIRSLRAHRLTACRFSLLQVSLAFASGRLTARISIAVERGGQRVGAARAPWRRASDAPASIKTQTINSLMISEKTSSRVHPHGWGSDATLREKSQKPLRKLTRKRKFAVRPKLTFFPSPAGTCPSGLSSLRRRPSSLVLLFQFFVSLVHYGSSSEVIWSPGRASSLQHWTRGLAGTRLEKQRPSRRGP